MKIALIDDEQHQLETLKACLQEAFSSIGISPKELATYTSGDDFFANWESGQYDIIILDIYMGQENGIDIARKIREQDKQVALAFCTSSNEFAAQSYEVEARYYLNKPISLDTVLVMLRRMNLAEMERNKTVRLPDGYACPLRHILYTEYSNHSVRFHLREQAPHAVYMNHSEVEALLLPHTGFSAINKGSIVNYAQVRKLENNAFVMQNGEILPIARRRYKEIEKSYLSYRFDRLDEEVSLP